jgi:hypothetical protein
MKEKRNLHLKVQELCDCYSTTDPLVEMSMVKDEPEADEAALKWLALAALHGINNNADKISISKSSDGEVTVTAKYRKSELPSPGSNVGQNVIEAVREITHLDGDKGKTALALGIRDSSVELKVKIKSKDNRERVTIKFPG